MVYAPLRIGGTIGVWAPLLALSAVAWLLVLGDEGAAAGLMGLTSSQKSAKSLSASGWGPLLTTMSDERKSPVFRERAPI